MDFKELGANLGLEEDEFIELVELFVETAAIDIKKMQSAFEKKNVQEVVEAAHSLKGSSGNLGFVDFSSIAKIVEENARQNSIDAVDKHTLALERSLEVISNALES